MHPTIDRRATGVRLRRMMDKCDVSVKELQVYLGLNSLQSIYHWLNGITLPTADNLYAISCFLGVTIDEIVCGTDDLHFCRGRLWVLYETGTHGKCNNAVDYMYAV